MAKAVYILTFNKNVNFVSDLKVYKTTVFIYLPLLILLSLLNSIISDFLNVIYSFNKLDCLIPWELFIDAYKFICNKLKNRLTPLFIYKLLLRQLIKTDLYYKLYLNYVILRFYYVTFNINRIKLRLLYEL